ncbi:hypothetical protein ScPMuIL_017328 [Solemya velum]
MSTPPEDSALKGGHAPAVKAGGMRIVQHKQQPEKAEQPTKEEEEQYGGSPPKTDKHHQSIIIAGAVTKGDKDFSSDAVKSYHQKPLPTHDVRPAHNTQHNIQQPRK